MGAADRVKVLRFLRDHADLTTVPATLTDELIAAIETGEFEPDPPIDTSNDYMLGTSGGLDDGMLLTLNVPVRSMNKDQALRLAAWLVALADPLEETFPKVLEAVKNT